MFRDSLFCVAIRRRVLVKLLFADDPVEKLFEPIAVYWSSERALLVDGVPIGEAGATMQTLEIAKVRSVSLTERAFVINPVVNRFTYGHGIICTTAR